MLLFTSICNAVKSCPVLGSDSLYVLAVVLSAGQTTNLKSPDVWQAVRPQILWYADPSGIASAGSRVASVTVTIYTEGESFTC